MKFHILCKRMIRNQQCFLHFMFALKCRGQNRMCTTYNLFLCVVFQVGDKTDWELGVAGESINRRGLITVRPDSGYWAICRRKGGSLIACAGPSFTLQLQENPKKVGVFLDYEKGSVTFYDTEAKTHIHTYSGNSFTEPLYPYFNPCHHDNGKNTAPLIICPVKP